MIKRKNWVWRGFPGHFCMSDRCRFHLCTDVGEYRISTVGAMYIDDVLEEIGYERHYETYVFKLIDGQVSDFLEIDGDYIYLGENVTTSNEEWDKKASDMHIKMCEKYAKLQ